MIFALALSLMLPFPATCDCLPAAQIERREGRLLPHLDLALAHHFKRRRE